VAEERQNPKTIEEFLTKFPDEAACEAYLIARRWPLGFICPRCGSTEASLLASRRVWQCRPAHHQTSITSGTLMHGSRLPLKTWFWATYLVTTLKPGISALQLQQQVGLARYETAWMLLQRLRRAMVNPDRQRLNGEIEIAVALVGGHQTRDHRGPRERDARGSLVLVAVEHHGSSLGRVRMEVIDEVTEPVLTDFALRNMDRDSVIYSDAWPNYSILPAHGYTHRPRSRRRGDPEARVDDVVVSGTQRVTYNLNTWLRGTHQGVGADQLQSYLDEFVFRFNRRFHPTSGFDTLLALVSIVARDTWEGLRGPEPKDGGPRRRGKATRFTSPHLQGSPVDPLDA
jgi:hypothetical protein